MTTIHVASAINEDYAQHLGVMLCSLFENNQCNFNVSILERNLSSQSLEFLNQIARAYGQKITFKSIYIENEEKFFVSGHITLESYLKVFLPKYIDSNVEKVLYLDADIIVNKSIEDLWCKDIEPYFVAAVEDVTLHRQKALQNPSDSKYFNAGVLLVNLYKWREQDITYKALKYLESHSDLIVFHDQDVLNAILHDKWLPLHPKYNMQGPLFMDEFDAYYGDPKELQDAIEDPVIIHFSAPLKPWHYLSYHPYTSDYYKYLSLTPWKDYKPVDKSWIKVIRRIIRPYLRRVGIRKVLGKHLY